MKTKTRIKTRIKLWKDGKLIVDTTKWVKPRILQTAQGDFWDKGHLKVTYDSRKKFINESFCTNYDDLEDLFILFTEKKLINYVRGVKNEKRV